MNVTEILTPDTMGKLKNFKLAEIGESLVQSAEEDTSREGDFDFELEP